MIENWLDAAKHGEEVWLSDIREECLADANSVQIVCSLVAFDGTVRELPLPLPRWRGEEERGFIFEYLCASVFNMLSSLSARKIVFSLPCRETEARAMLAELDAAFGLRDPERSGLGKVVNIADRLSEAFGGGNFSFVIADEDARVPPTQLNEHSGRLAPLLREAVERSSVGLRCGIDVGGTDIKAVLAVDGRLVCVKEYDWDPASSPDADGVITPILRIVKLLSRCAGGIGTQLAAALAKDASDEEMDAAISAFPATPLDAIGVSFPDIVIRDRIVGFETPKMSGIRKHSTDREREFARIRELKELLLPLCREGGSVRITNDGHVAALSAAAEKACGGEAAELCDGVVAYALGTDFGTGFLSADGSIPECPMEFYCFLLDLGSRPQRLFPGNDLRSTLNENSLLPDARRYLAQSAAFRIAMRRDPSLLEAYAVRRGDIIEIPSDSRKACLEHMMSLAEAGNPSAAAVFREIGRNIGQISREMEYLLSPRTRLRYLFGRLVKHPACFEQICEGCREIMPELRLECADDELACTGLMRALPDFGVTAAQFGQAVGAIYLAAL